MSASTFSRLRLSEAPANRCCPALRANDLSDIDCQQFAERMRVPRQGAPFIPENRQRIMQGLGVEQYRRGGQRVPMKQNIRWDNRNTLTRFGQRKQRMRGTGFEQNVR